MTKLAINKGEKMTTQGKYLKVGLGVLTAALLSVSLLVAADAPPTTSGKDLYAKKCASCHGKQGEGVAKMATMLKTTIRDIRGLSVPADTLTAWKKITVEGKKKMPAFKTKLSVAEIETALAYMQQLAKSPAPAKADRAKGAVK
jgi:mono/diheme cytochrome c family protein